VLAAVCLVVIVFAGAMLFLHKGQSQTSSGPLPMLAAVGPDAPDSQAAFLEELVYHHNSFSESSRGVDAGVLLVNGAM
jgi:hypothetical protein